MAATQPATPIPPAPPAPPAYTELCGLVREASTLHGVGSLLGWDQETYMPPAGAAHRADQQALISALYHEKRTSARIGELLGACEGDRSLTDGDGAAAANLREMRRDYERAIRVPTDLVAELARTGSLAQEAWKAARAKSDFPAFAPWLEKMMALTRRKAECLGVPPGGELYDALLDEYEPGMTAARIEAIFTPLRARLAPLIAAIGASRTRPDTSIYRVQLAPEKQHRFGQLVLAAMGFDFTAGRLDVTTHPFCSGVAPGDTRLTTRYTNADGGFLEPLSSTMHEGGHGLYEQGLPKGDRFGQPLADAISLGIHESQSRMWENFVGRSRPFWTWALPKALEVFAPALDRFTVDDVYGAANMVTPSYIRVESDEATYNLHVMLRFEIERAMINGGLAVRDLPGAWNERFERYLGLKVPDDRRGCLQDVHWSFGLIGYFPTYTLGNLYAAQFWETINAQIPDLDARTARGDFTALKAWLNSNIHAHGKRFRAAELCERLTGKPLSADPLMRHLEGKLRPIYGV